jgi:transposase
VLTAVTVEKCPVSEVARSYGVARSWVYKLLDRYVAEGEAAFEPRSRRPKTSPNAVSPDTAELIVRLRKDLAGQGMDAWPHTIAWHLEHHHRTRVSAATVSRTLSRQGLVTPDPAKRPKSSQLRFAAELPGECWQSDFTHYPLAGGADTEILTWLDDHSRYALSLTARTRVTGPAVLAAFRAAAAAHGAPASALTDNGLVFTTRFAGGRGGRNALEAEPPPDPGQGRALPADDEELAPSPGRPARHARRAAVPAQRVRRHLQHPPPAPLTAAPRYPRHRLRRTAQGRARRPHRRHPRPRPHPTAPTRPGSSPCASTAASTTSAPAASTPGSRS